MSPGLAVYVPSTDRPSSVVVVSVTAEDHREATTVLRTRSECDAAIAQLVAARDAAFAEKMRRCVHDDCQRHAIKSFLAALRSRRLVRVWLASQTNALAQRPLGLATPPANEDDDDTILTSEIGKGFVHAPATFSYVTSAPASAALRERIEGIVIAEMENDGWPIRVDGEIREDVFRLSERIVADVLAEIARTEGKP